MALSTVKLSKLSFSLLLLVAVLWMYQGCKGCNRKTENSNKSTTVRRDMSLAETMKIMGAPDEVDVKTDTVVLTYFSGGLFVSDAKIFIDNKGRVVELWSAH